MAIFVRFFKLHKKYSNDRKQINLNLNSISVILVSK